MQEMIEKARRATTKEEATFWFEPLYQAAQDNPASVPWANMVPNPRMVEWLDANDVIGNGRTALVIGVGLGDDAEELARRGFAVTAFDLSETAIRLCQERFPESQVEYVSADMFAPPAEWLGAFDFALEINIVQALPLSIRAEAIAAQTQFVAPNGELLLICRSRPDSDTTPAGPPWPLSPADLAAYESHGLKITSIEQFTDTAPRYRVLFKK